MRLICHTVNQWAGAFAIARINAFKCYMCFVIGLVWCCRRRWWWWQSPVMVPNRLILIKLYLYILCNTELVHVHGCVDEASAADDRLQRDNNIAAKCKRQGVWQTPPIYLCDRTEMNGMNAKTVTACMFHIYLIGNGRTASNQNKNEQTPIHWNDFPRGPPLIFYLCCIERVIESVRTYTVTVITHSVATNALLFSILSFNFLFFALPIGVGAVRCRRFTSSVFNKFN